MRDIGSVPFLRFNFYYFNFFTIILKAKWPDFVRGGGANYFSVGVNWPQAGYGPALAGYFVAFLRAAVSIS